MTNSYRIAVLPGDGIGKEVTPEGLKVLRAAQNVTGSFDFETETFDWGSEYYIQHGRMMPKDALKILAEFDALYFGAIGMPAIVPDHITLWEFLLPIRKSFDLYINLRPIRLLPGSISPLRWKGPDEINFLCVRENTEGEYSGVGGIVHAGTPHETALQTGVFTRVGVERVIRYAFELARKSRKKVTSATKSNALQYSMVFWDRIFQEISAEYPDIQTEQWHVDALSARFITRPETLDVVVASNLFGDILSDLGGALLGSLGMLPSANINPEKRFPSMFEPVHGSAPDIAGKGIANPIASIWTGAMMLDFLGESQAAGLVMQAIEKVVQAGKPITQDLGGSGTTSQVGDRIAELVQDYQDD